MGEEGMYFTFVSRTRSLSGTESRGGLRTVAPTAPPHATPSLTAHSSVSYTCARTHTPLSSLNPSRFTNVTNDVDIPFSLPRAAAYASLSRPFRRAVRLAPHSGFG